MLEGRVLPPLLLAEVSHGGVHASPVLPQVTRIPPNTVYPPCLQAHPAGADRAPSSEPPGLLLPAGAQATTTSLSQDITDDNSATIRACLCHSDFCNAGHLGPHHQLTSVDLPHLENPVNPLPLVLRQPKQQSDHSRIPQTSTSTDLPGNGVLSSSTARPVASRMTTQPVTEEPRRGPGRRIPSFSFPEEEDKTDTFPDVLVDKNTAVSGPLKCFSCGSLFHPDRQCDEFDITSPMQVRELGGWFVYVAGGDV